MISLALRSTSKTPTQLPSSHTTAFGSSISASLPNPQNSGLPKIGYIKEANLREQKQRPKIEFGRS